MKFRPKNDSTREIEAYPIIRGSIEFELRYGVSQEASEGQWLIVLPNGEISVADDKRFKRMFDPTNETDNNQCWKFNA